MDTKTTKTDIYFDGFRWVAVAFCERYGWQTLGLGTKGEALALVQQEWEACRG